MRDKGISPVLRFSCFRFWETAAAAEALRSSDVKQYDHGLLVQRSASHLTQAGIFRMRRCIFGCRMPSECGVVSLRYKAGTMSYQQKIRTRLLSDFSASGTRDNQEQKRYRGDFNSEICRGVPVFTIRGRQCFGQTSLPSRFALERG
jgi:hypothetical protein